MLCLQTPVSSCCGQLQLFMNRGPAALLLLRQHVTVYCCFQACDTLLTLAAISLVVLFSVTSCTPPLLTMSRALQSSHAEHSQTMPAGT